MDDSSRVWKVPANPPKPTELADAWSRIVAGAFDVMTASATRAMDPHIPQPYDPAAPARAFGELRRTSSPTRPRY
jgi:hypothetical protein